MPTTDPGFHPHASGLLVPDDLARKRQVWTKDEGRLLDRLAKLLNERGMLLNLACQNPKCAQSRKPLERFRMANGDYVLRCECTDRVFQKGL